MELDNPWTYLAIGCGVILVVGFAWQEFQQTRGPGERVLTFWKLAVPVLFVCFRIDASRRRIRANQQGPDRPLAK
jgi:hypothetical protein